MDYRALYDKVVEGRLKPLPAYIDMKAYADDLAITLEALKQEAINEFNNEWGGTEQVIHGALVARHQGGRYNYKDVPGWKKAKENLSIIESGAQKAAKADSGTWMDEETGEVFTAAKYVPNKESITIKMLSR